MQVEIKVPVLFSTQYVNLGMNTLFVPSSGPRNALVPHSDLLLMKTAHDLAVEFGSRRSVHIKPEDMVYPVKVTSIVVELLTQAGLEDD